MSRIVERRHAEDIEALARERILERLEKRFSGRRLFELVAAILELRGLVRRGSDAALDGCDEARFVSVEDPTIVRLHLGVFPGGQAVPPSDVTSFANRVVKGGAEHGLLVALRGLAEEAEAAPSATSASVHVWTRYDVLEALLAAYERLPRAVQVEIPLKRMWTLAA